MDAAQVENAVHRLADVAGLQVTAKPGAADGYVELALTAPESGDRIARIATNGVEMFLLRFDDRYNPREFDWEPDRQQELLRTLVAVAAEHLRGSSRQGSQPRRFRRDREFLEVEHGDETFRAWAR